MRLYAVRLTDGNDHAQVTVQHESPDCVTRQQEQAIAAHAKSEQPAFERWCVVSIDMIGWVE